MRRYPRAHVAAHVDPVPAHLAEDPADAEVPSHRLLVRAGYVRRVAPGVYSWLPLGYLVLRNIERIVREEMERIGAQECTSRH